MPDILFRRGFICYPSEDAPTGDNTWRQVIGRWSTHRIGAFTIRTHPETRLQVTPHDGYQLVLIGDAFSTCEQPLDSLVNRVVPRGGGLEGLDSLEHLSGRFAILVLAGSGCFGLHDAFGARSLFYRRTGALALASHAQLLAHAFGIERRPDIRTLLRTQPYANRVVKYLPGNATVYEDVYALVPNNYLASDGRRMRRYWPTTPLSPTTLGDFFAGCDAYFDALVRFFSASAYQPVFGVTGGIDSRAVLAAFTGRGIRFRGVTWLGGYLRPEERETVDTLVARYGIDHAFLKPETYKSAEAGEVAARNSGNFRGPSRLTQGMHELFGDDPSSVFIRGYGGEIIRGFYNLRRDRMKFLGPSEMARLYGFGSPKEDRTSEYTNTVLACFQEFFEQADHQSLDGLGFDPSDLFYWEHRMGMWGSSMLNEMDSAVYSMVGLNSRALYRLAFGLPEHERLTKELLKAMAGRNDPTLLEVLYL